MRLRHGLAALLLVVALAGCGGDEASSVGADSAATVAPASAALYVSVDTDLESGQWEQLNELLDEFPGKPDLVRFLREALEEEDLDWETDVKPALGPTLEVVGLDLTSGEDAFAVLAKPADEAKFEQLVEQGADGGVTRELEGWTVAAATEEALDRFEEALAADEKLADEEGFAELMGELPEQALAKAWFDAEQTTDAAGKLGGTELPGLTFGRPIGVAAAVEAVDEGVSLVFHARSEDVEIEAREWGELLDLVPADAYAFVNFHGQDGQLKVTDQIRDFPGVAQGLGGFERMVGVTLEDVSSLFNGEMILWVRPGTLIPEVTLVLEVENEAEARATVDELVDSADALGDVEQRPRQVGDVEATEVDLGQVSLLYATVDGKLVLTTQPSGIEGLEGGGDKLADSDAYEDAVDAAGVPDDERVVLWVDLRQTLDVVRMLAALGDEPIPPEVDENLEPLGGVLFSAAPDFERASGRVFVHVR